MKELLAPAGDKATAICAVNHGADAVYVGYSSFSARASAVNCGEEELAEVIRYAHFFGAKVYVAMNTIVKDGELDDFLAVFLKVYRLGADAIIMQDVLLGKYLHEKYPDVCLHLSTQAGVNNADGARFAKECGFSRVILARETPLSEIAAIASIMETEVFVQGALCTCFSGQCYFSSFVGGNSGNRGRCKQPCRKKYTYHDGKSETGYALSLADLCVGKKIDELIAAGVSSFKIEGRMRRVEYVAAAVRYYRALLDGGDEKKAFQELRRSYNRGNYTVGLAFGQDKNFISDRVQGHIGEKIGVLVRDGKGWLCRGAHGREGDGYKILRGGEEVCGALFQSETPFGIRLSVNGNAKVGDELYITTDSSLSTLASHQRRRKIAFTLHFAAEEVPTAVYRGERISGDEILQAALGRPLSEEEVAACFAKTGDYPFEPEAEICIENACFAPKSALNAFRRKVYAEIYRLETERSVQDYRPSPFPGNEAKYSAGTAVMGSEFLFSGKTELLIFKPFDYADGKEFSDFFAFASAHAERTALWVPAFLTDADRALIVRAAEKFDALYCEGLCGIPLSRELGKEMIAGTGFNLTNAVQVGQLREFVWSKELPEREQRGGYALTAGSLKLMDLIYCPFKKRCESCDRKHFYKLKDEAGRVFLVRRYRMSSCRFELYNCAELVGLRKEGALFDFSTVENQDEVWKSRAELNSLKACFASYTAGHSVRSVL